jgi:hypothetical protein
VHKIIKFFDYLLKKVPFLNKPKLIYDDYNEHPIYIYDNIFFRWLNFGNSATQSRICKIFKNTPTLTSVQTMSLAGELYKDINKKNLNNLNLTNILILGLGGGDLVRYYYKLISKYKNNFNITAIEKYPEIIDIAKKYFYLNPTNNINIQNTDAYEYILTNHIIYNIIAVDFFIELDSEAKILQEEYLAAMHNKLDQQNGILVINLLISDQTQFNYFIKLLHKYFQQDILITENFTHYNIIVFAFKSRKYLKAINNPHNKYTSNFIKNVIYNHDIDCHTANFNN